MAVIVRFVSDQGKVMERFLAIKHLRLYIFCSKGIFATCSFLPWFTYFLVDIFNVALDATIKEMNHRFNEVSSELVVCMSCLDPRNSFSRFSVNKLVRLAEIYGDDFTISDRLLLRSQLQTFIINVRRSEGFNECHDVSNLAQLMVQTNKHLTFPLVYRLIELALILPVATLSVERIFLAMSIIKTDLHNKIADGWLNDLMVCYTEREIFKKIDDDAIMKRFQALKTGRISLPRNSIADGLWLDANMQSLTSRWQGRRRCRPCEEIIDACKVYHVAVLGQEEVGAIATGQIPLVKDVTAIILVLILFREELLAISYRSSSSAKQPRFSLIF